MKKKGYILIIIIVILLGIIGFISIKNRNNSILGFTKDLVSVKSERTIGDNLSVINTYDLNVGLSSTPTKSGVIYSSIDGNGFVNYYGKEIRNNKNETIEYFEDSDLYIVKNKEYSFVYRGSLDEENLVVKTTDYITVEKTINDKTYLIINNTIYNLPYINEYKVDRIARIKVLDSYIINNDQLIDTSSDAVLGEVISINNIGNKYILLKGDKYFLYDLSKKQMSTYNSMITIKQHYVFDNKFYLSLDGEVLTKDNRFKRKINDYVYIDYQECEDGFNLFVKNKKYSDICYKSVVMNNGNALVGDADYKIAVFKNGRVQTTKNSFELVSDIVRDKSNYYNEKGSLKNSCADNIINYNDTLVCSGTKSYFLNHELKAKSEEFDAIVLLNKGVFLVSKDSKYGLASNGELITEISFPSIISLSKDTYIVKRPVKNLVIKLGTGSGLGKIKYSDVEIDLDINKVIEEYDLKNIESYIRKDEELFKKYAYIAINNREIKPYLKPVLEVFMPFIENKKYLNEGEFFYSLANLKIIEVNKLDSLYTAGEYYDGQEPNIKIVKGEKNVIYHELMHFIDGRIAGDTSKYNTLCLTPEGTVTSLEGKNCLRYISFNARFLVEAGAETYATSYLNKGTFGYRANVDIYNTFAYIFGGNLMNDIFFSPKTSELFVNELLKYGMKIEDIESFDKITKNALIEHLSYNDADKVEITKFIINLYKNKYKKDWYTDKKFAYILSNMVGGDYAYSRSFNKSFSEKERMNFYNSFDNDGIKKQLESHGYILNKVYIYKNGEDWFLVNLSDKIKYVFYQYDINNDKVLQKIVY